MAKPNPLPWPHELQPQVQRLINFLQSSDELGCAIIGAAFLDHCLGSLLQKRFAQGDTTIALLQPGKSLGEFTARANIAYTLGLIPLVFKQDIETVANIRNRFAHQFFDIDFSDEKISKLCTDLRFIQDLSNATQTSNHGVALTVVHDHPILVHGFRMPETNRDKYSHSVFVISDFILHIANKATHAELMKPPVQ